jgi:hypothetical protein
MTFVSNFRKWEALSKIIKSDEDNSLLYIEFIPFKPVQIIPLITFISVI